MSEGTHEKDDAFNARVLASFREHGAFLGFDRYCSGFRALRGKTTQGPEDSRFMDEAILGAFPLTDDLYERYDAERVRAAYVRLEEIESLAPSIVVVHKGVNPGGKRGEDFRLCCIYHDFERSRSIDDSFRRAQEDARKIHGIDVAEFDRLLSFAGEKLREQPWFVSKETPGAEGKIPFDESLREWDHSKVSCPRCLVLDVFVPTHKDRQDAVQEMYSVNSGEVLNRWRKIPRDQRDLSRYLKDPPTKEPASAVAFLDHVRSIFHESGKILVYDNYYQAFVVMRWSESRDEDIAAARPSRWEQESK